jgi:hypothetical protein
MDGEPPEAANHIIAAPDGVEVVTGGAQAREIARRPQRSVSTTLYHFIIARDQMARRGHSEKRLTARRNGDKLLKKL